MRLFLFSFFETSYATWNLKKVRSSYMLKLESSSYTDIPFSSFGFCKFIEKHCGLGNYGGHLALLLSFACKLSHSWLMMLWKLGKDEYKSEVQAAAELVHLKSMIWTKIYHSVEVEHCREQN